MLDFYDDDADEVAAYYIARKTTIKINRSEVFDWLISNADSLSEEFIEALAKDKRNTQITIKVGVRNFPLNRLQAALCSLYFRANSEDGEFENLSPDLFKLVADWIQDRKVPPLKDLDEEGFKQFQQLLNFLGVEDDLMLEVAQENIRRYQLKFNGNALILGSGDKEKFLKLHPCFLHVIHAIELKESAAEFLPLLQKLHLVQITLHEAGNLDCSLLKDLKCKLEIIGPFPKGAAGATANLVNLVIQQDSDWTALPGRSCLERVVVENVPMDLQRLKFLHGLKSIHIKFAPLGDPQVIQLCKQNPDLETLILPKSACGKEGFAALAALKHLKELQIGSEGFTIQYTVTLPRRGSFKSFIVVNGFTKLERLTLLKGSLSKEELIEISNLPKLKDLDISQCTVSHSPSLFTLLQSGKLASAKIPCIGDRHAFEYEIHRRVPSRTDVTILSQL